MNATERSSVAKSIKQKPPKSVKSAFAQGWQSLRSGSLVDIVAPGSACGLAELLGASQSLKEMGLVPRYSRDLFQGKNPILSAPDSHRFLQLKRALLDSQSEAVWCLRGGYGSLRLLPELSKLTPPKKTKLFIGYSDITSLHIFLQQQWGWSTLHAPVLERLGKQQMSARERRALFSLMFGSQKEISYKLKPLNARARRPHRLKSTLTGGNLSVLQSGIGTEWQVEPRGKFLFIEDIFEKPHRVDRMLHHFLQAGLFEGCHGVLFGDFILEDKKLLQLMWRKVVGPFVEKLKIPALKGLPCGHGPLQMPLPFGTKAELVLGDQPLLTVEAGSL